MSDHTQPPPFNVGRRQPTPPATETPTLRDQFAIAALTGILADHTRDDDHKGHAANAYEYADAMLAARKRKR